MGVDQRGPHLPADGPPDGRRLVHRGEEPVEQTPKQLLDLVDPGLVWLPLWRPDDPEAAARHPERTTGFAGVGRRT